MAKHRVRTRFGCGHLGKGVYCHRCKQGRDLLLESEKMKDTEKREETLKKAKRLLEGGKSSSSPTPTAA